MKHKTYSLLKFKLSAPRFQVSGFRIQALGFKFHILFILLFFVFFVLLPSFTNAKPSASLYFLPNSGSFNFSETISIRIIVDTGGQTINAIEDKISFSSDILKVVNISKEAGILKLWIQEPAYDNTTGIVTFGGGIPNPGFTGVGRIFMITFEAKDAGSAWVKFDFAQVLANDGLGTNILASTGRADFTIKTRTTPEPVSVVRPPEAPAVSSKVSSSTHLDQNKWYAKSDVIFTWTFDKSITNFSYILDRRPGTNPDEDKGLDTSTSYSDLADGVWYFHLKAKIKTGWENPVHYRVQIDTIPPYIFEIVSTEDFPTFNPVPLFRFEAEDETSGISYIRTKVDDGEFTKLDKIEYRVPFLEPGKHQLIAEAYDLAGHMSEDLIEFEILSLARPKIMYWTKQLLFGEPFLVTGSALPETKIKVTMLDKGEGVILLTTQSDSNGIWLIEYTKILKKGAYGFMATQEIATGIVSLSSEKRFFEVVTNAFRIFGIVFPESALIWLILFLLAVVAMIIVLTVFLHRTWHRKK